MSTTTIKRINANFSISSIGKIIAPWNLPISGGYSKKEVKEVAYRLLESGFGKLTFYQDCDPPLAWEVNGRAKTITVFVNGERTKVYFFEAFDEKI